MQQIGQGNQNKEAAAETLSNLSQQSAMQQQQPPQPTSMSQGHIPYPSAPTHFIQQQPNSDPGPSSHPNGPPMMGMPNIAQSDGSPVLQQQQQNLQSQRTASGSSSGNGGQQSSTMNDANAQQMEATRNLLASNMAAGPFSSGGRKKSDGHGSSLGSEEWARKRKDNHVRTAIYCTSRHVVLIAVCFYRKRLNAVGGAISMMGLTSWLA